jgi:hypothetical protein
MSNPEPLDLIDELKLRRWARENYVDAKRREAGWHPVVHDEMSRKDVERREVPAE